MSDSDPDGDPFLERPEKLVHELALTVKGVELKATLPPHSVVFVAVEREKKESPSRPAGSGKVRQAVAE